MRPLTFTLLLLLVSQVSDFGWVYGQDHEQGSDLTRLQAS